MLALVLKLSERRLMPLYLQVCKFSKNHHEEPGSKWARRAVLYDITRCLAEQLKSIFCPFFDHVVSDMGRDIQRWATLRDASAVSSGDSSSDDQRPTKRRRTSSSSGDRHKLSTAFELVRLASSSLRT